MEMLDILKFRSGCANIAVFVLFKFKNKKYCRFQCDNIEDLTHINKCVRCPINNLEKINENEINTLYQGDHVNHKVHINKLMNILNKRQKSYEFDIKV